MPYLDLDNARIRYEIDGAANAPVLLLSNSLGTRLEMWAPQMPALLHQFRVLRYDTRGQGESSVPLGEYSLGELGGDVIGLLDRLRLDRVLFCGLSMGGLIGTWLGVHHPDRLHALALCNTGAKIGTTETWKARIDAVHAGGMRQVAPAVIERWFTARYRKLCPEAVAQLHAMLVSTSPAGYVANCAAIRDADLRDRLTEIRVPSLVIAGTHDAATPPDGGRLIAERVAGAKYVELDAAHLSNWEQAGAFTAALLSFLTDGKVSEPARRDAGMLVRRAVLGDTYVDRAQSSATDLNRDFQDLITRYAWGEIWNRPGLTRHTRSLLTIAFMVALNRPDELRLHLRVARNNGVSADDIKELLMHAAVYCGVPAANAAFHLAAEMLAEAEPTNGSIGA